MLLTGIVVTSALYLSNIFNRSTALETKLISRIGSDVSSVLVDDRETSISLLSNIKNPKDVQYAYITPNGTVLYETVSPGLNSLPNNIILELTKFDEKMEVVISDSIGENYYHYSSKLKNGDYLVVSRLTDNALKTFSDSIPALLGILGLGLFISIALSKRIVDDFVLKVEDQTRNIDINDIDISNKYIELYPFIRIIKDQRENISKQVSELHKQSNTINTIISNMREGMILTDLNYNILSMNSSVLDLLNITSDINNFSDKNLLGLIRDELFISNVQKSRNSMDSSFTSELKIKNRFVTVLFNPVMGDNKIIGYVILLVDDTRQKLIDLKRTEFSANVSHELKTPLTSINGYAEILKSNMVPIEDVSKFGTVIYDEGRKLLMMIDDIIELSRLDEGNVELQPDIHNLSEIIHDVIETLSQKAESKNISIDVIADGHYPFRCNYQLLRELFINLIDNGIKYNKENGNINVEVKDSEDLYTIVISDTGIGISEEDKSRIFERFYTVDKSHNKKDSSGLGLAIVKHIVRLYKGSITVESKLDEGATFVIRLPKENN